MDGQKASEVRFTFSILMLFLGLPLCHQTIALLRLVAGTTGLEPATSAVTGQRSNQLSYVPSFFSLT